MFFTADPAEGLDQVFGTAAACTNQSAVLQDGALLSDDGAF